MKKKIIIAGLLSVACCLSVVTGCGNSSQSEQSSTGAQSTVSQQTSTEDQSKVSEQSTEESSGTASQQSEQSEQSNVPETSMHTIYIRDEDKNAELTATFVNINSGNTHDVPMNKVSENDGYNMFTCEGDTEKYNMLRVTSADGVSKEISFNKLVSGWWMNGGELIPYAEGTDPHAEPKFETKQFKFDGDDKNVYIWTPADYDAASDEKYSTIYMTDGQNSLTTSLTGILRCWNASESVTSMMAASDNKAILVCIDTGSDKRETELMPDIEGLNDGKHNGTAFKDFVCKTIVPYVQQNYNVYDDAKHTSIAGSSLGGLESYYIAMEHPEIFGTVGAFSPSFWAFKEDVWKKYIDEKVKAQDHTFVYVYAGSYGSDTGFCDEPVYNYMVEAGYPKDKMVYSKNEEGEHNELYWRNTFPEFLESMFCQRVAALESGVKITYIDRELPDEIKQMIEQQEQSIAGDNSGTETSAESSVDTRPDSVKNYVFFDNSETKWEKVYAYWWGASDMPTNKATGEEMYIGDWPGFEMEQIEGTDIYRVGSPLNCSNIIFSSGVTDDEVKAGVIAYQTDDLAYSDELFSGKVYKIDMSVAPKKGSGIEKTKFRYKKGSWSDYEG